jgi:3-oxoacyl-[acyl-carrier protein] reductase
MTRVLALELGRKGILANCVAPGVIEAKMSERIRQAHEGALLEIIAVRRFGQPEEVAEVVAFIASDASAYVTGQVIRVDGGMDL